MTGLTTGSGLAVMGLWLRSSVFQKKLSLSLTHVNCGDCVPVTKQTNSGAGQGADRGDSSNKQCGTVINALQLQYHLM